MGFLPLVVMGSRNLDAQQPLLCAAADVRRLIRNLLQRALDRRYDVIAVVGRGGLRP
jgi:hypothetical protein